MEEFQIRDLLPTGKKFINQSERSGELTCDRGQFHLYVCNLMRTSRDVFQLLGVRKDS